MTQIRQISAYGYSDDGTRCEGVYALAWDGSLWNWDERSNQWFAIAPIPQSETIISPEEQPPRVSVTYTPQSGPPRPFVDNTNGENDY